MSRCLIVGFVVIALVSAAIGQEKTSDVSDIARTRNKLVTPSPAWVGQEVSFYVELLSPTLFAGTPRFDLPSVSGVILMKVEGSPVLGTEQFDGTSWSIQRHEFRVYAHRDGHITIPPFSVRFSVVPAFGTPPQEQRMMSDAMEFDARLPPGAEGVALLVSTSDLDVKETWDPKLDPEQSLELQVGDAITRTIAMRASDVPGMALPPVVMPSIDGVATYPKTPTIDDATNRGDFIGQRTESVTYVCERPGAVMIPEIVLTWWDVNASELHHVTLPAATIHVVADTARTAIESESTASSAKPAVPRRRTVWICVLFALIATATWLMRKRLASWLEAHSRRQSESEKESFHRVRQACLANDAPATFNALMTWIDQLMPSSQTNTLESFSQQFRDAKLSHELNQLERAVIHSDTNWNGRPLWHELRGALQHHRADQPNLARRRTALPALNPGEAG